MAVDANLQRQLRNLDDMIRSSRRNIENIKQQTRLLERQERDAARLPNAGREQQRIREQIKQARRDIDRLNNDVRTFERQQSELKRMSR
jgi:DNA repair exonuclease SbcCD ATPase subunit